MIILGDWYHIDTLDVAHPESISIWYRLYIIRYICIYTQVELTLQYFNLITPYFPIVGMLMDFPASHAKLPEGRIIHSRR